MTASTKTKPAPLTDDEKAARLQEAQDVMAREVEKLQTSGDWLRYLQTATKFHTYSWNNVFLMLCQAAERGMAPISHVAGFHTWRNLKRSVNKGERGLKIFRPVLVKIKPGEKGYDPANPDRRKTVGFTLTSVFDIQQTDGEPIAEQPVFTYPSGEVPFGLRTALADFAKGIGFPISYGNGRGAEGFTTKHPKKHIVVDKKHQNNDARASMIALHEIAHAMLHMEDGYDYRTHRGIAETEAESVAYIVGTYFGIDVGEQSFHYVTGWAPDLATVLKVGDRVMKTARTIIDAIEPDVAQIKVEPEVASEPVEPVVVDPEPVAEPVVVKPVRKPRKPRATKPKPVAKPEPVKPEPTVGERIDANLKAQREAKPAEPVGPPTVGGAWALFV